MVVARSHDQQMPLSLSRPAINEERFLRLRRIDRDGNMVGGVGAKSTGVFIAIGRELPEREPDTAIAIGGW
jgi:hypothetical protein